MSATMMMMTEPGLARLEACLQVIAEDVRALKERMSGDGMPVADGTRPMTAAELCARGKIEAESPKLKLQYLARRCRAWGLVPLRGSEGWGALYMPAAVLRAEEFASGAVRSRAPGGGVRRTKKNTNRNTNRKGATI